MFLFIIRLLYLIKLVLQNMTYFTTEVGADPGRV